jgi:hypothetical protein
MTINKNSNNDNYEDKSTETWIEAYQNRSFPDIKSFESFSLQFLSQVNDHNIKPEELISILCVNNFSCFAVSSLSPTKQDDSEVDPENIPMLSLILHPFKEVRSLTFNKKEKLFGIILNMSRPKEGIKTLEFNDPLEIFTPGPKNLQKDNEPTPTSSSSNPSDPEQSGWIRTPAFEDFFDDGFLDIDRNNTYQPLNNATEIAPAQEESIEKADDDEADGTPTPLYCPRKTIALTPAMVEIILENRIDNFNGIINGIREYAWQKVRTFKKKESCKPYLDRIYYTLQALWAHGQSVNSNDIPAACNSFLHCDPSKLAKITTSEWAIEKTKSITDSLAVADGKLKATWKSEDNSDSQGGSDYDNDSGEKTNNKHEQSETFVVDFLANIINKASN